MDIIYLCYNIYMESIEEIQVIEADLKDCNTKCQRVNCVAIYDAIISTFKLIYDLLFVCCKKKD